VTVQSLTVPGRISGSRGRADRIGDRLLQGLTAFASLLVVATIGFIIYQLIEGAQPAMSLYGFGFLGHNVWNPAAQNQHGIFGAAAFIYGTAVTSAIALVLAGPIGIAIGLYLSLLAPRRIAAVVGPLIELIAAVPSVVLGLWGLLVLAPLVKSTLEPAINAVLGWIPLFGTPFSGWAGEGVFTAGIILTIMVVPIIASISRELFQSVPNELKEGALALGATRWEMVRGVVLASSRPGLTATLILGLSRALGEAIAVTQVIGGGSSSIISGNLFNVGDTLASRVANAFQSTNGPRETASIFYLAVILLAFGLLANLTAQTIVRRYEVTHRVH
jgi:phosphate transport system permease protein